MNAFSLLLTRLLPSLIGIALIVSAGVPFAQWGIFEATFIGSSDDCRAASGACWAFVVAKARFILFAFYPSGQLWRPTIVIIALIALMGVSALPRCWGKRLIVLWLMILPGVWLTMAGAGPLTKVPVNDWGGLPITLLVWSTCMAFAFPVSILLALARQSSMAGLRWLSICYIEMMRALPMVAILYVATLILPLALPQGFAPDKITRATVMTALFFTAYLAEVVRGGLQTVSAGQAEAAAALGLGYWRIIGLIVLPQALRKVIPGLVNLAIGFLLATSLLAVIGVFDLLNTAKAAASDPKWLGFYDEAYLSAAVVYFGLCFAGSRYSLWLEHRLNTEAQR